MTHFLAPGLVDNWHDETDNLAMNVSLPIALEEFVHREVAAGQFKSADEMVCEALRLLHDQHEWKINASRKIEEGWEEAKSGALHAPEKVRRLLNSRKKVWSQAHSR
jgi:putative addiction module CopG family antidote